ncbi:hypothetical protein J4E86_011278 [Alternaria arbusti]|uniref:uncharacterized protein n=1 Tax=Alternaria arbusti TaxID=232088 RepID=UPI00221E4C3D|nr:uncharacterized protein J4E86_011278 [Alternaria arbusti]KAI4936661.1 hypothetical protein J4E86_011278 [Alternaria arbusti]
MRLYANVMPAFRRPIRTPFIATCLVLLSVLTFWKLSSNVPNEPYGGIALNEGQFDKALVIASMKHENTSWFYDELPEWRKYVYVVNDPTAELTVPLNKGRESMVYLSFIIDNYHKLPGNILFLHAERYQWHNDDPDYDGLSILRKFRFSYLQEKGYLNLRCVWVLGCPNEIRPFEDAKDPARPAPHAGQFYKQAFEELFPGRDVPRAIVRYPTLVMEFPVY